ncbi:uncharacterized protein [Ptychodera flava]|uniref:uncharacterized protein isoform X2 n=1 Tax=Ptychodera flava TaxID=63121 RepID=UPI00396A97ED
MPSSMVKMDTSKVPPPRSKIRTLRSSPTCLAKQNTAGIKSYCTFVMDFNIIEFKCLTTVLTVPLILYRSKCQELSATWESFLCKFQANGINGDAPRCNRNRPPSLQV